VLREDYGCARALNPPTARAAVFRIHLTGVYRLPLIPGRTGGEAVHWCDDLLAARSCRLSSPAKMERSLPPSWWLVALTAVLTCVRGRNRLALLTTFITGASDSHGEDSGGGGRQMNAAAPGADVPEVRTARPCLPACGQAGRPAGATRCAPPPSGRERSRTYGRAPKRAPDPPTQRSCMHRTPQNRTATTKETR